MKEIFATAINCIDGRAQRPVIEFVINRFKVDYVDLVTEAGPDKILSEGKERAIIESIKRRVSISIEKHKSKIIIVAGHYNCAANPVGEEEHYRQIREAVTNVKDWGLEVNVYGIWVGENWEVVLL